MEYRVLAVGDVVGEPGLRHLERHLRPLQKLKNITFTVVNGENASGVGLTEEQARRIVLLHAVTGLKHREIAQLLELPLATVLSKYHRALKKLKAQLEGDDVR